MGRLRAACGLASRARLLSPWRGRRGVLLAALFAPLAGVARVDLSALWHIGDAALSHLASI